MVIELVAILNLKFQKKNVGYFESECGPEYAYPISNNTISISPLIIQYRATRFDIKSYESVINMERWWEFAFENIVAEYPDIAEQIKEYLDKKISYFAEVQSSRGYKSTWVYHQFLKNNDKYSEFINGTLLAKTKYFYYPLFYFNQYSYKLISVSERERDELNLLRTDNW